MSFLQHFSHLYIEDAAESFPLTASLKERFSRSTVVPIQHYKEIFNRPRQRWDHQRGALKLILAVRRDNFLYKGSHFVPSFEHPRFYYNTPVLNCLYGCEYCYLQGMSPSANIVVFVNIGDFTEAACQEIGDDSAYLCVSYDTDLLALEHLLGYCSHWIEHARCNPATLIEIRTKSANFSALRHHAPQDNVILAWTLSPHPIAVAYEHRTPSLGARVASVREALEAGWKVRLCLDPILHVSNWRHVYADFVNEVFTSLPAARLHDVSLGVFRISSGYLRAMQSQNPAGQLINYSYTVKNGSASYSEEIQRELLDFVTDHVAHHVPKEKVCPILSPL